MTVAPNGPDYLKSISQRRLDVAASMLALGVLGPMAAVVAAQSMAEHRQRNPLFRQQRVGMGGSPLTVSKFQTVKSAPDGEDNEYYMGGFNHPGVGRAAHIIRRTGLDEYPQLALILQGQLHMRGIRPLTQATLDVYEECAPRSLWSEWREMYDLNLGLVGEGQLFIKSHPEQTPQLTVKRMEIETSAAQQASLGGDIRLIGTTPLTLIRHLAAQPLQAVMQGAG